MSSYSKQNFTKGLIAVFKAIIEGCCLVKALLATVTNYLANLNLVIRLAESAARRLEESIDLLLKSFAIATSIKELAPH